MNDRIYNQLLKINPNIMPQFDKDSKEIIIHSDGVTDVKDFEVNYKYRIKLESYMLIDNANFSFHTNWNHGNPPKDLVMDVVVLQVNNSMIRILGYGINTEGEPNGNQWEGWLPKKSIKIIAFY